ncbi:MAG: 4Fe-4S binding protein [Anaerolineae bacterium]|nr:4Fe-4S binding protein [Anaerolineae bacterium]
MGIFDWFIKPSTREFFRESKKVKDYSLFDLLHGYIYLRWPFFYISMGKGDHPMARRMGPLLGWIGSLIEKTAGPVQEDGRKPGFADTYHGKVVPLEAARQLVTIKEDLRFENLEQVIPYTRARDLIVKNPDHIAVLDCPCRASQSNPCLPMDVCLIVGEPFSSFVLEHMPDRSRKISSQEAEQILKAEDDRGHVHHAFFKDAILGRFYAICNCCSCCCGAMKAQRSGTPMLCSSGYVSQVDESQCAGCGTCATVCQFDAIEINGFSVIAHEKCMGCGVCVNHCPQSALHLVRDERRGVPLELNQLMMDAMKIG